MQAEVATSGGMPIINIAGKNATTRMDRMRDQTARQCAMNNTLNENNTHLKSLATPTV